MGKQHWYLGAQNDGLFIINAEPRPSNDHPWHDRPDGPTIVLNITELPKEKAEKIVGVMNEITAEPKKISDERAIDLAYQICTGKLSAVQGAVEIMQYATDAVLQHGLQPTLTESTGSAPQ